MVTKEKVRPTGITLDKNRRLMIVPWSDGHTSEYPWAGLREACPCAECRGGHEGMGAPPDPDVFTMIPLKPSPSYGVKGLQLAGNYALQIEWDDGHAYGIYTWEYLRGLCPCEGCTSKRNA